MEVGRGLLGDQHAVGSAQEVPDPAREGVAVAGLEPQHLAGGGGLHRAAGPGLEAGHVGVADRLQGRGRGGLADRVGDLPRIGPGDELHLPVDRQPGDRVRGHLGRRGDDEGAERGQQPDGERHADGRAGEPPRVVGEDAAQPKADHAACSVSAPGTRSTPRSSRHTVRMRHATLGSWVATPAPSGRAGGPPAAGRAAGRRWRGRAGRSARRPAPAPGSRPGRGPRRRAAPGRPTAPRAASRRARPGRRGRGRPAPPRGRRPRRRRGAAAARRSRRRSAPAAGSAPGRSAPPSRDAARRRGRARARTPRPRSARRARP